jgi:hypothetical protein
MPGFCHDGGHQKRLKEAFTAPPSCDHETWPRKGSIGSKSSKPCKPTCSNATVADFINQPGADITEHHTLAEVGEQVPHGIVSFRPSAFTA